MKSTTKDLIRSHLVDYLRLKFPDIKATGSGKFKCPFESEHKNPEWICSSKIIDGTELYCRDEAHRTIGDIFAVARRVMPDWSQWRDEAIGDELIKLLHLQTDEFIDKALNFYTVNNWDLVPVAQNDKNPIETGWPTKVHKDVNEWRDWLAHNLNIGVKTGKVSNVTVVDFDFLTKAEKDEYTNAETSKERKAEIEKKREEHFQAAKNKWGKIFYQTLQQKTTGGFHFFCAYEGDIPNTNFECDGFHVDVRNDGGQVVIYPSIVKGQTREWTSSPILKMPDDLKKWLLERIGDVKKPEATKSAMPNFDEIKITGLQGCCNNTFIKLGGWLRKFLNPDQTSKVLFLFNSLLAEPMEDKAIRGMLKQLEQYDLTDKNELETKVLAHLQLVQEATARDLKDSLGFPKADVELALSNLLRDGKIYKLRNIYRRIRKSEWKTSLLDNTKPIDFKMPYFENVADFREGDMIIIGAKSGVGKTHVAMNIIKKLVAQGKKPNYVSLETGNRFKLIALQLGLKECDFNYDNDYHPESIELDDDAITIIDWLLPEVYAEVDQMYKRFAEQLDKHRGILIVFCQLKNDGTFFSPNMVDFFASLLVKFLHPNKSDRENAVFETAKIRESKSRQQYITIPVYYSFETKTLEVKEIK